MWWETLKGSISGVKLSMLALRETGGGLVVAPAEKASLLALSLTANSVVSSLSLHCFFSLSLGAIPNFCPPASAFRLIRKLVLIHLVRFLYFKRRLRILLLQN